MARIRANTASGGGGGIRATFSLWVYGTYGSHYVYNDSENNGSDGYIPYTNSSTATILDNDYIKVVGKTGTGSYATVTFKKDCVLYSQTATLGSGAGYSTAQTVDNISAGTTWTSAFNSKTVVHAFFY